MTREVAPGPFRSFWIRIFPFFEPKPPATQSSSASRSTRAWWVAKCQVSRREVLDRDVLELRALADEELGDGVRVAAAARGSRRRTPRSGVKREPLSATTRSRQKSVPFSALIRDPDVERPLELDALRDVDEQAVRPERGVVGGELLVPADERVEPRVDPRRAARTVTPSGTPAISIPPSRRWPSPATSSVDQLRPRRGRALAARERVRVEAAEVGEPPRLLGRRRYRQLGVAGRGVGSRQASGAG